MFQVKLKEQNEIYGFSKFYVSFKQIKR